MSIRYEVDQQQVDLRHHGDSELAPGLVDLAVNVRAGTPPRWLVDRLARVDLSAYPNPGAARAAVANRHGRLPEEVLMTAGAAEAFVLLARVLRPRHAVVVHPQFTEPEAALRAAGHEVKRCVLRWPFVLEPEMITDEADLVVVGNPTNPTSVLHSAAVLAEMARPGRTLVVDEAFADCVPAEPDSLAHRRDLPGLVVIRSLTKTWGLAGLRAGYLLAAPDLVRALGQAQPLWAVSSPALEAAIACSAPAAVGEASTWAKTLVTQRESLINQLHTIPGVDVVPDPQASFVLVRTECAGAWASLRRRGFAARRCDTFPGLDANHLRVAVRDPETSVRFTETLREVLNERSD